MNKEEKLDYYLNHLDELVSKLEKVLDEHAKNSDDYTNIQTVEAPQLSSGAHNVAIKNVVTNKISVYSSFGQAERALGVSKGVISSRYNGSTKNKQFKAKGIMFEVLTNIPEDSLVLP